MELPIHPFSYEDPLLAFASIIVGLIVGAEREYHNKTAGLRTLMLVSVGSCIFTILSIKIGTANPDRLAANVVTGIGFLGAGAIFKDENKMAGLTTACTIWVTAALGMCVGSGHVYLALMGSLIVVFVLSGLSRAEHWIDKFNKTQHYSIATVYTPDTIRNFEDLFRQHHLKHVILSQNKTGSTIRIHWKLSGSKKHHKALETVLLGDPAINDLQF